MGETKIKRQFVLYPLIRSFASHSKALGIARTARFKSDMMSQEQTRYSDWLEEVMMTSAFSLLRFKGQEGS